MHGGQHARAEAFAGGVDQAGDLLEQAGDGFAPRQSVAQEPAGDGAAGEIGRQQAGLGQAAGQKGALGDVARQAGAGFQPRQGQHQQPGGGFKAFHRPAEPEQIVRNAGGQVGRGQRAGARRRFDGNRGAGEKMRLVSVKHPDILHPAGDGILVEPEGQAAGQHLPGGAVVPGIEAEDQRG